MILFHAIIVPTATGPELESNQYRNVVIINDRKSKKRENDIHSFCGNLSKLRLHVQHYILHLPCGLLVIH